MRNSTIRLDLSPFARFLEAYSGIFFIHHPWAGFVILCMTFWVPNIGAHGLIAGLVGWSVMTLINRSSRRYSQAHVSGAMIVNCILIGLFLGVLYKLSTQSLLLLTVLCVNTGFIYLFLDSILSPQRLPVLSIPFSISASIVLSSRLRFSNLEWFFPYHWENRWGFETGVSLLDYGLKSLSSIIFIPNTSVGILLLGVFLLYSRIQSLVILVCIGISYALDSIYYIHNPNDVVPWINFNLILFSLSIGGFFLTPGLPSLLVTSVSLVFCFFSFEFFISVWSERPEWIHSLPYALCCLSTIVITRRFFPQLLNRYLHTPPELSLDLTDLRQSRFGIDPIILDVPLKGSVSILQGFSGKWTHQGQFKYALDFVIKNGNGKTHRGEGLESEDYFVYGQKVLAPCSGWVESVENGRPDQKVAFIDECQNWGNHILLRTVGGFFVLLAHLRVGSVRLRPGDPVYLGQELAEVGNSGYSPEPHLHLQVQKAALLGSETLPFHLEPYAIGKKIEFYSVPIMGQVMERLRESKSLQYAMNFRVGDRLMFDKYVQGNKTGSVSFEIGLEPVTGRWHLQDEKGGSLSFWRDSKHFYFYDLICGPQSDLKLMLAALPMVPLTYGQVYRWSDHLPSNVHFRGVKRILFEVSRFLKWGKRPKKALYRMSADGMRVNGRVIYGNKLTRTEVVVDPKSGIRSIVVGQIKLLRVLLFLLLVGGLSASQVWAKEIHERPLTAMEKANQLIKDGKLKEAIAAYDKIYWTDFLNSNDALFYIIYCQDRAGDVLAAQKNIAYLKLNQLPLEKKSVIYQIQLKTYEPPSVRTDFFSLAGSGGGVVFAGSSIYRAGTFYGFNGSWTGLDHRLDLGYNQLQLIRIENVDFRQEQFSAGFGFNLGQGAGARLSWIKLWNNDPQTNTASIYSLGLSYSGKKFVSSLVSEMIFSSYPSYVPGGLQVLQAGLGGTFRVGTSAASSTYLTIKGVAMRPATLQMNSDSQLNQNYFFGQLAMSFVFARSTYGIGGWYGRQLFAVDSEGPVVFNVQLERNWGLKGSYNYALGAAVQMGIFASTDAFREDFGSAQSFSGGGALNIFF